MGNEQMNSGGGGLKDCAFCSLNGNNLQFCPNGRYLCEVYQLIKNSIDVWHSHIFSSVEIVKNTYELVISRRLPWIQNGEPISQHKIEELEKLVKSLTYDSERNSFIEETLSSRTKQDTIKTQPKPDKSHSSSRHSLSPATKPLRPAVVEKTPTVFCRICGLQCINNDLCSKVQCHKKAIIVSFFEQFHRQHANAFVFAEVWKVIRWRSGRKFDEFKFRELLRNVRKRGRAWVYDTKEKYFQDRENNNCTFCTETGNEPYLCKRKECQVRRIIFQYLVHRSLPASLRLVFDLFEDVIPKFGSSWLFHRQACSKENVQELEEYLSEFEYSASREIYVKKKKKKKMEQPKSPNFKELLPVKINLLDGASRFHEFQTKPIGNVEITPAQERQECKYCYTSDSCTGICRSTHCRNLYFIENYFAKKGERKSAQDIVKIGEISKNELVACRHSEVLVLHVLSRVRETNGTFYLKEVKQFQQSRPTHSVFGGSQTFRVPSPQGKPTTIHPQGQRGIPSFGAQKKIEQFQQSQPTHSVFGGLQTFRVPRPQRKPTTIHPQGQRGIPSFGAQKKNGSVLGGCMFCSGGSDPARCSVDGVDCLVKRAVFTYLRIRNFKGSLEEVCLVLKEFVIPEIGIISILDNSTSVQIEEVIETLRYNRSQVIIRKKIKKPKIVDEDNEDEAEMSVDGNVSESFPLPPEFIDLSSSKSDPSTPKKVDFVVIDDSSSESQPTPKKKLPPKYEFIRDSSSSDPSTPKKVDFVVIDDSSSESQPTPKKKLPPKYEFIRDSSSSDPSTPKKVDFVVIDDSSSSDPSTPKKVDFVVIDDSSSSNPSTPKKVDFVVINDSSSESKSTTPSTSMTKHVDFSHLINFDSLQTPIYESYSDYSKDKKNQPKNESLLQFCNRLFVDFDGNFPDDKTKRATEELYGIVSDRNDDDYLENFTDYTKDIISSQPILCKKFHKFDVEDYCRILKLCEILFEHKGIELSIVLRNERVGQIGALGGLYLVAIPDELRGSKRRDYLVAFDLPTYDHGKATPLIATNEAFVKIKITRTKIVKKAFKSNNYEFHTVEKVTPRRGDRSNVKNLYEVTGKLSMVHFHAHFYCKKREEVLISVAETPRRTNPLVIQRTLNLFLRQKTPASVYVKKVRGGLFEEIGVKEKGPVDTYITPVIITQRKSKMKEGNDEHLNLTSEYKNPSEDLPFIQRIDSHPTSRNPIYTFYLPIVWVLFIVISKLLGGTRIGYIDTTFKIGGALLTFIYIVFPYFDKKFHFIGGGALHWDRDQAFYEILLERITEGTGMPLDLLLRDGDKAIKNAIEEMNQMSEIRDDGRVVLDYLCKKHIWDNIKRRCVEKGVGKMKVKSVKKLVYDMYALKLEDFDRSVNDFIRRVEGFVGKEVSTYVLKFKVEEMRSVCKEELERLAIQFKFDFSTSVIEGKNNGLAFLKKVGMTLGDAMGALKTDSKDTVRTLVLSLLGEQFARNDTGHNLQEKFKQLVLPREFVQKFYDCSSREEKMQFYEEVGRSLPELAMKTEMPILGVGDLLSRLKFKESEEYFIKKVEYDIRKLFQKCGLKVPNDDRIMAIERFVLCYQNNDFAVKHLPPSSLIYLHRSDAKWYEVKILPSYVKCEKHGQRKLCGCVIMLLLNCPQKEKSLIQVFKKTPSLDSIYQTDPKMTRKLHEIKRDKKAAEAKKSEFLEKKRTQFQKVDSNLRMYSPSKKRAVLFSLEELQSHTKDGLIRICKFYDMKGYSKFNLPGLVQFVFERLPEKLTSDEVKIPTKENSNRPLLPKIAEPKIPNVTSTHLLVPELVQNIHPQGTSGIFSADSDDTGIASMKQKRKLKDMSNRSTLSVVPEPKKKKSEHIIMFEVNFFHPSQKAKNGRHARALGLGGDQLKCGVCLVVINTNGSAMVCFDCNKICIAGTCACVVSEKETSNGKEIFTCVGLGMDLDNSHSDFPPEYSYCYNCIAKYKCQVCTNLLNGDVDGLSLCVHCVRAVHKHCGKRDIVKGVKNGWCCKNCSAKNTPVK